MTDTIASSNPSRADVRPDLVMEWQTSRPARTLTHEPLYTTTPHVTFAPAGTRRGTLKYFFLTASAAQACWEMHTEEAVLTLDAAISDMAVHLRYVVTGGDVTQTLDTTSALRFTVEVPYLEVPA